VPPLRVEWADSKGEGSCNSDVKSLHVSTLPDDTSEEDLREAFLPYGAIERIALLDRKSDRVGDKSKKRDYAFVHYEKRSTMLKAFEVCLIVCSACYAPLAGSTRSFWLAFMKTCHIERLSSSNLALAKYIDWGSWESAYFMSISTFCNTCFAMTG
jgi:hypothetical protein